MAKLKAAHQKDLREHYKVEVDQTLRQNQNRVKVEKVYVRNEQYDAINARLDKLQADIDSKNSQLTRSELKYCEEMADHRKERESSSRWFKSVVGELRREFMVELSAMKAALIPPAAPEQSSSDSDSSAEK